MVTDHGQTMLTRSCLGTIFDNFFATFLTKDCLKMFVEESS